MKPRTLLTLLILLGILIGAHWLTRRPGKRPETRTSGAGNLVLGDFDVNAVARIEVARATNVVRLARKEDRWTIETLHDYPADFARVVEALTGFADLKAGPAVRGGADMLDELGLDEESTNQPPTRITLADETGRILHTLLLGNPRRPGGARQFAVPQGSYLRVDDGQVLLVDETFSRLPRRNEGWIQRKLLALPEKEIARVEVVSGQDRYTVTADTPGHYALAGLAAGEEANDGAMGRLFRAFGSLSCISIADPAQEDNTLGLPGADQAVVTTTNGLVYTIHLGTPDEKANNRYVRIEVAYQEPPAPSREDTAAALAAEKQEGEEAPTQEEIDQAYENRMAAFKETVRLNREKADAENARFSGWTYLVPNYTARQMAPARADLIKKKPPPKKESSEGPPPASS